MCISFDSPSLGQKEIIYKTRNGAAKMVSTSRHQNLATTAWNASDCIIPSESVLLFMSFCTTLFMVDSLNNLGDQDIVFDPFSQKSD